MILLWRGSNERIVCSDRYRIGVLIFSLYQVMEYMKVMLVNPLSGITCGKEQRVCIFLI